MSEYADDIFFSMMKSPDIAQQYLTHLLSPRVRLSSNEVCNETAAIAPPLLCVSVNVDRYHTNQEATQLRSAVRRLVIKPRECITLTLSCLITETPGELQFSLC